jgi:hypothetical protein
MKDSKSLYPSGPPRERFDLSEFLLFWFLVFVAYEFVKYFVK